MRGEHQAHQDGDPMFYFPNYSHASDSFAGPEITGVDPSEWQAGTMFDVNITGSGFGSNPSIEIDGDGVSYTVEYNSDTQITLSVTVDAESAGGDATITITPGDDGNWFEGGGGGGGGQGNQATAHITPAAPVVAMKLELLGTVISTDGNYSEDSSIRVTAVDATTHQTLTNFTGTVTIAEDGTGIYSQNPAYGGCLVYWQGSCSGSNSISITAGGTATFLARSEAGPKTEGQNGSKPGDAKIKTADYPVDGGASLTVPQWIISGTQFDPKASDYQDTYDWFQHRMKGIYNSSSGDLRTILDKVSGYTLDGGMSDAGKTIGSWGAQTLTVKFNPYSTLFRLDFAQTGFCGLPDYPHSLTYIYYHEARHAYQNSLDSQTNDEDQDYLVNNISIAPSNIFIDTTDSRTVCDEMKNVTQQLAFKGKNNPDAYGDVDNSVPGVGFAIEMDAHTFASQH